MKRSALWLLLTVCVIAMAYSCGDGQDAVVPERANRAPTTVGAIPALETAATDTATVDVAGYFTDPDGDALTYAVSSSNTALVTASVTASVVSVIAGVEKGTATVSVTARDPRGLTATQSIAVTVVGKSGFLQVVLDYAEPDVGAVVLIVEGPVLDSLKAQPDLEAYDIAVPGGVAVFLAGDLPQSGPILTFWTEDFTESGSYSASVAQAAGKDYDQRSVAGAATRVVALGRVSQGDRARHRDTDVNTGKTLRVAQLMVCSGLPSCSRPHPARLDEAARRCLSGACGKGVCGGRVRKRARQPASGGSIQRVD